MGPVRDAECPLLTKIRQQHMLNELKRYLGFNVYFILAKMQLNIIMEFKVTDKLTDAHILNN